MLGGAAAFDVASSIATAGLCLAYALPIGFRILFAHHSFEPGPFTLGRYCHPCLQGFCNLHFVCKLLLWHLHSNAFFPLTFMIMRCFCTMHCLPSSGLLGAGFAAVMHLLAFLLSFLQACSTDLQTCLSKCLTLVTRLHIAQHNASYCSRWKFAWRICYVPRVFPFCFLANLCLPKVNTYFLGCALRCLIRLYTSYTNEHICLTGSRVPWMRTFGFFLRLQCCMSMLCQHAFLDVHGAVYWGWSAVPPTIALQVVCAPITSALSKSQPCPLISSLTLRVCCTGGVFQLLQWPVSGYYLLQQFSCCHKRFH